MRRFILAFLLAVAGCQSGPPPLSKPDKSAATWDLNPGRWPGTTNDLIHEPVISGIN